MSIKDFHALLVAWCIHLFTALGVICGFQALLSTLDKNFNAAVLWLALALFIDGIVKYNGFSVMGEYAKRKAGTIEALEQDGKTKII